ncbi:MAG: DsbA family protein [Pseudomonadota bacterium]|nr:DsbA family protein [Pseudomonadota bacterium]
MVKHAPRFYRMLLSSSVLLSLFSNVHAVSKRKPDDVPMTQQRVESIIQRYINANPDLVYQALVKYQKKQQEKQAQNTLDYLKNNFEMVFKNPKDGTIGNPDGNIHLVVLSDRQCGYCKKAWHSMENLVNNNKAVRVSFKEVPILGPASVHAAKIAIYAQQKGVFSGVDRALIEASTPLDNSKISQIALQNGLTQEDVKAATESDSITQTLQENMKMAQEIGLQGTPMLFIASANGKKVAQLNNFMDENAVSAMIASFQK